MAQIIEIATTVISAAELAKKVADTISQLIPEVPATLKEKYRWIQCTVRNETEFDILLQGTYFDSGKYWDPPSNIKPFEQMAFAGSNGDHTVLTGVSGGTSFRLSLDTHHYFDFAVGWTNPSAGAVKAGVVESTNAEDRYNIAAATGNSIQSSHKYQGLDKHGKRTTLRFHVQATAGHNSALYVIREVRVPE
ncbi:hypothetical protein B0H63DRAFT_529646 [Podospora didyma]|uniref:Uncharacterized protein n=1 Tax=Podospora didyma TaxID=330526 RepID=A0AAE0K1T8_9PEZI|nr:hypothetical protein B0H63DRAFT_529646 [Podospora didyma]